MKNDKAIEDYDWKILLKCFFFNHFNFYLIIKKVLFNKFVDFFNKIIFKGIWKKIEEKRKEKNKV